MNWLNKITMIIVRFWKRLISKIKTYRVRRLEKRINKYILKNIDKTVSVPKNLLQTDDDKWSYVTNNNRFERKYNEMLGVLSEEMLKNVFKIVDNGRQTIKKTEP